ncbi:cytochrome b [Sphingomicrobium astaxanthinifaciens]|uniref:cytochrome b n=1 Tax=Sphingomicrobium astaxanthinifaciens TaxID=1227949 RepID=UPI001FCB03E6|nr:cytochrome b/b6 domain-containing protein [Sphingomicrobium astaxanthinifaciens]MCJ7421750.1 cytochrome b/b6 domain-containing protein [Sphingomicrobium astaxanthinifaciens]
MQKPLHRYSTLAAFWHWLAAALVIGQFTTGWLFHKVYEKGTPERLEWFSWHKTIGAALIVVVLLRLLTRFFVAAPKQPPRLPGWQRVAAGVSHFLLYVFLVAIPLGGLMAVSDGTSWVELKFGLAFPAVPGVTEAVADWAGDAHETYVWAFAALLGVHLLAAAYHQSRRDSAAGRMPPFSR